MNPAEPMHNRIWPSARRWNVVGAAAMAFGGIVLAARFWPSPAPPSLAPEPTEAPAVVAVPSIDPAAVREKAWDRIRPRLAAADRAAAANIQHGLDELRLFFEDRKRGARPFAEAILSLGGKWALVRAKLPFTDNDGHLHYLSDKFAKHVFRADELQASLENAVKAYLNDLRAVENQLLVDVRADLADLPSAALPLLRSDEVFRAAYANLSADVAAMAVADAGIDMPRWVGSWVAGDLAAKIAVRIAKTVAARLGVSAGLWSAGAAGSWASFGLSIVAAVVVDIAADWVIGWFYDPVGDVSARVGQTLDRIRDLLTQGDVQTPGLRHELEQINRAQAHVRRDALRRLVFGNEDLRMENGK